ncbi:MAG TPA: RNA polymerase-binding protein DksA [Steroidobacteraceae bacterium]|nr:RNA polymerase-binding protein DksA [Steroidobacteraceae bacterium]
MPAKKPAPKAAKGKKAASRPPARKPLVARKPAERATPVPPAHARKSAAAPKKVAAPHHRAAPAAESAHENHKPVEAAPAVLSGPAAPAAPSQILVPPRASAALQSSDSDDSDTVEPGSLLAGPRNVQPYIVKRGELYMSKEQLEHFRQILLNWKQDLMVEVDRTVSHMKDEAANFPDPNDRATQEEEFSLELRTRDRERKLIRKIDEALKRIEDGSYGYCLETGEEIGIKRLEARPVATLSIEAQERRERRERQYGDRDDRYR